MKRARVPRLASPDVVIRLAHSGDEIRAADALVYRNYVAEGFWRDDPMQLEANPFLHTAARTVLVALQGAALLGTLSIIEDSAIGLPSDGTQAAMLRQLRGTGERIAEVSALAMERGTTAHGRLILFLISYLFQYAYYHAGLDRLIASCKPEHADFYESVLCFRRLSALTYYDYSHAAGYLVSLDLREAHELLARRYAPDPDTGESLYRFLMRDPQPCHRFPGGELRRPRRPAGGP